MLAVGNCVELSPELHCSALRQRIKTFVSALLSCIGDAISDHSQLLQAPNHTAAPVSCRPSSPCPPDRSLAICVASLLCRYQPPPPPAAAAAAAGCRLTEQLRAVGYRPHSELVLRSNTLSRASVCIVDELSNKCKMRSVM